MLGLLVAGGMLAKGRWMLEVMGADQSQQHMQDLALQYLWFRWVAQLVLQDVGSLAAGLAGSEQQGLQDVGWLHNRACRK